MHSCEKYLYPAIWKDCSIPCLLFSPFPISDHPTVPRLVVFALSYGNFPYTFAMISLGQRIAHIEGISGHTFQNILYCIESIQMANEVTSMFFEGNSHSIVKSTRLAIIGNELLNLILSTMWYEYRNAQGMPRVTYQKLGLTGVGYRLSKAEWTRIQQDLVNNNNNTTGLRGFELGLDRAIITVPGLERVSNNMMATTVQAILGAVFEDSGANDLSAVRTVVETMGLHHHSLFVTFTNILSFSSADSHDN